MANPGDAKLILNPNGAPARPTAKPCVQCGAGPDRRVPAAGFGPVRLICGACGYEVES
jgi:hypothetical protein